MPSGDVMARGSIRVKEKQIEFTQHLSSVTDMLLLVLFGLSLSAAFAQPSRDWFLKFSDMIRDNKVDDAFFETEEAQQDPKYKDYLNTPGMGDGSFTSLQWAAKVRDGCVWGAAFFQHPY